MNTRRNHRPTVRHILDTRPGTPRPRECEPQADAETIYVRPPEPGWESSTQTLPGVLRPPAD
ncbi:hypothetical protein [Niveibacterium umoris]|uniref:Uncharacterized protein n=1 Tax=Niveibacterium umoris TaxID=1193620 RepID=A0A840BSC4_9RHOO|nr:hypothetical protein [Niveibacterium umoris]MBB4013726.1 hypothetical protein [Niveibacterium umoris]